MSTVTCPQCSAEIPADVTHCPECGHPLAARPRDGDDATASAGDTGPGPGDIDSDGEIRQVTPRPRPASDADPEEPAAPVVICRSCGTANPVGRTLCERCGMGLMTFDDVVDDRWGRAWRGAGLILGLALIVVVGAVAGWLLLRDGGGDGVAAPGGGVQTPSAAEPTVASEQVRVELGPGDTGPQVRAWQRALRAAGLDVDLDGVFGAGTEGATRRFQASVGQEPTGEVTSRTLAAARYASALRPVGVFLLRGDELARVRRRVDETQLARGAVEALVAAPLASERDAGLSTAIPRGVTVVAVSVGDGTATVRLRGFATATGAGNLQARVDQVVRTLTRFDSIDAVRFALPADDMAVFADAGIPLDRPRGAGGGRPR